MEKQLFLQLDVKIKQSRVLMLGHVAACMIMFALRTMFGIICSVHNKPAQALQKIILTTEYRFPSGLYLCILSVRL